MKKIGWVLLIVLLVVSWQPLGYTQEWFEIEYDEAMNPYVAGQLIVGYSRETPANTRRSIRAQNQLELKSELRNIDAEVIRVKNERAREVLQSLRRNPNVAFVEYDYVVYAEHVPNDPIYPSQVFLPPMNTPSAWDVTKGDPNVVVAVLDTGLRTDNRDLRNMIVSGYNVIANSSNYTDDHGHGTMVTSVIAAEMDNTFGIAGIAPKASFLAVKVMNSSGSGTYSDMIKGIDYAVNNGAKVINMSIGGRSSSSALKLAIDQAVSRGVTIVAAAGNEGLSSLSFPAAYDNVIGVGAVDINNNKTSYSNTGAGLTLMAGGSARVATFTDFISSASGTSFAAPYVSGAVALMLSADTGLSPSQIMQKLGETALDLGPVGYDLSFGYGLIDMGKAVESSTGIKPVPLDTLPPTITLLGEENTIIELGQVYVEMGATAWDDVDGDITGNIVVTGAVNTGALDRYVIAYDVKDAAGNAASTVFRYVDVVASEPMVEEEPEYIELEPETMLVRDVEVVSGSLSKRTPTVVHDFQTLASGTMDVSIAYSGRNMPSVTIGNQSLSNANSSIQIASGSHQMTISSGSNLNFTVTLTHPEREVPIDIPLGAPEVIIYGESNNAMIFLILFLAFGILAFAYLLKRQRT